MQTETPTAIAGPSVEASVTSAVQRAEQSHGDAVRADSRYSPPAVAGQRAMLRHCVVEAALAHEHIGRRERVDSKRITQIVGVMAEALGLREENKRIEGMEARADSYFAPGELIARDTNPIRVRDQRRAVQDSINSRNIDPGTVLFDSVAIGYEGTAAIHKPGMTSIPSSTYGVGATKRQVHSIVTMTDINWEQALYGAASSINQAGENAESADRNLRRALEGILVLGATGTELKGLFGANRIQLAGYHSALDYTLDATTLGQIYADLQAAAQAIQEANDDRGGIADTWMPSPKLLRLIARKSNIDDGGSLTGNDLFFKILQANSGLGEALKSMGISAVIPAPSLNVVPGAAGTETDRAGSVFFERGNAAGLRRVIALAPSPVRTAETLLGTQTLWALRTGGIECPDATSAGIATFKVR